MKNFIETNHRNPSKHRIEEHLMLNFIKHNRKLLNAGKMKTDRIEKFNDLLALDGKSPKRKRSFFLNRPYQGLYVKPGMCVTWMTSHQGQSAWYWPARYIRKRTK